MMQPIGQTYLQAFSSEQLSRNVMRSSIQFGSVVDDGTGSEKDTFEASDVVMLPPENRHALLFFKAKQWVGWFADMANSWA